MYEAFLNLNTRFHNLLTNSTLPINIHISTMSKSTYQRYYTEIIMVNTHRINSLRLSHLFIYDLVSSPIRMLSNFLRLERLILDNIESNYLTALLPQLISLPILSSLTISSVGRFAEENNIYHYIFRLPTLKYCKLSIDEYFLSSNPLPFAVDFYSPIEYLIINSSTYLDRLYSLLSYVPQLRHFSVKTINENWLRRNMTYSCSFVLNHLKSISLGLNHIKFDRFQQVIRDLFSTIQILYISIKCNEDVTYKDDKKWEQLILFHLPNLRIFDIRHEDWSNTMPIDDNHIYNQLILDSQMNQFKSSFWIERRWFFALQHYRCRFGFRNREVFYSINPYRY